MLCTHTVKRILPTPKVYPVQARRVKKEIREVEEGMEKAMKRFSGEMNSLLKMLVCRYRCISVFLYSGIVHCVNLIRKESSLNKDKSWK